MVAQDNAWDLGGGGESFPFDNVGDEIEGYIQDVTERQSTDVQTGEPTWWDKEHTRPKMVTIVTLQTSLKDSPQDDGMRNVTLAGSKKPESKSRMAAVFGAVKAATGGTALQYNAWLKMKYVGDGPRTKVGFNPPKYFEAWYRPPVHDLENGANAQPPAPTSQLPQQEQQPARTATPADGGITAAQVAGLRAAGVDPAVVYGEGWESRVTP